MKKLIFIIATLLCANSLWAVVPSWTVSSSDYQYSMQVYAIAEIDGVELNNSNDMLAAFSGGECRGVVKAQYNSFIDKDMFFLVAYSNTNNEALSFKVYDSESDDVIDVVNSITFQMNADVGSVVVPYVMSTEERISGLELIPLNLREDASIGTSVAQLIYYVNGTAIEADFTLVDSFAENADFLIQGDSLVLNSSWNYEQKSQYAIKVLSTSTSGNITKEFSVELMDVNEASTAMFLSHDAIDENKALATVVGYFSVDDEDAGDEFEYTLQGENPFFEIVGNELRVKANLNYEFLSSHLLSVLVNDKAENSLVQDFEITVNDVNDVPQLVILSADSIPAGLPEYMTVGCLTVIDEDVNDVPVLSLVEGEGDNDAFMLNPQNHHLVSASTLSMEDGDTRTLKVKADDGNGGILITDFDIKVLDKGYTYTEKNVNVMFTQSGVFAHVFELEGKSVNVTIETKDLYGNYAITSTSKVLKYEIYSVDGKKLLSETINQYDFTINISAQSLGHYFLNIYTESGAIGEEISVMAK